MFCSCCIGICVKILTCYNAIMGSFCVGGRCFGARFFFISVSFHMKFVINRTAGALKH